jgi:glycosyltransferase involved in cell wall biosynthesis
MKILFVYRGKSESGSNEIIENQARSLLTAGKEITLFPIREKGIKGYIKNVIKLSKFLKSQKIDIIHAHYGLSGIAAYLARKNERLIVSFMGSDLVRPADEKNGNDIRNRSLIRINVLFSRYFYDFSIVKSDEMGKQLLNRSRYAVIPNGVDLTNFYYIDQNIARLKLGLAGELRIVLFASNPSRVEKNYALSEIAVSKLNVDNAVLMTVQNQPYDTLPLYYNAADVLLLTSLHEGSPNVVKEAMACNCPVVSTRVGDVEKLFGDVPGYFTTSFNPDDVAEKVRLAFEFRRNFKQTTGAERISFLGLDSETVAGKITSIYDQTLK